MSKVLPKFMKAMLALINATNATVLEAIEQVNALQGSNITEAQYHKALKESQARGERTPVARQRGRMSRLQGGVVDEVCNMLALGEAGTVRAALRRINETRRSDDQLSSAMFWMQCLNNPEWKTRVYAAQEAHAEIMADEMLDIADDNQEDWLEGSDGVQRPNYDHIGRSKLKLDTRRFLMAKRSARYSEKIDVTSDGKSLNLAPIIMPALNAAKDDSKE